MRLQVRLTFLLDVKVRPTFGQMDPLAEKFFGQACYYFGQVDLCSDIPPRMRLWVRLTFSQTLGQADLCFFPQHFLFVIIKVVPRE